MKLKTVEKLYDENQISVLPYGRRGDKLGEIYEISVMEILNNKTYKNMYRHNVESADDEYEFFCQVVKTLGIKNVHFMTATMNIPRKNNGANPKTDIIVKTLFNKYPISIKQSCAKKVAVAES